MTINACGWKISLAIMIAAFFAQSLLSHSVEESTPRKLKYLDVDFSSTKHKYSEKCVQIDIIDHRIAVKNKELIVSEYGCRGRIGNKIGDIIYIYGGPYQSLGEFPDPNLATFMMAGYDVFVPIYTGSFENTIATKTGLNEENTFGGGELEIAAGEVAATVGWLRNKNAQLGFETILAGESAGGYVAGLACVSKCTDRLLLISPLMQSPMDFWKNYGKRAAKKRDKDYYKYVGRSKDSKKAEESAAMLASIGFYGTKYRNTDIAYFIERMPTNIVKRIFVGDRDPRIGVSNSKKLQKMSGSHNVVLSFFPDKEHRVIQTAPDGGADLIAWLRKEPPTPPPSATPQ
jgi:hypothetical protein